MAESVQISGACPTWFRAACWSASRGEDGGYEAVGHSLAAGLYDILSYDVSADELEARLAELACLIRGEQPYPRSAEGFLASPDAPAAARWLRRELPRCMALVPAGRPAGVPVGRPPLPGGGGRRRRGALTRGPSM